MIQIDGPVGHILGGLMFVLAIYLAYATYRRYRNKK